MHHKSELSEAHIEDFLENKKDGENNQELNLFRKYQPIAEKTFQILTQLEKEDKKGIMETYKGHDIKFLHNLFRTFLMNDLIPALKKHEDERVQMFEYNLIKIEEWLDKIED